MHRRSEGDQFASERAAYEAHIKSLTDQITWLRTTVESLTGLGVVRGQSSPALPMETKPWMSEEEEDIQEMLAAGLIDHSEAQQALEAVGALSTEIDFAPRP